MTDDTSESHDDDQSDDQPADPSPTGTVDVEVDPDGEMDSNAGDAADPAAASDDVPGRVNLSKGPEDRAPGPSEILDKEPEDVTEEDIADLPEEQRQVARTVLQLDDDDDEESPADDTADEGDEADEGEGENDNPYAELQQEAQRQDSDAGQSDDSDADDDDDLEPGTLAETGLTDDEDNFSWEDEFDDTEWGEQSEQHFTYKGTDFKVSEPENTQKVENAARHLEGVDDMSDKRRKQAMFSYYDDLVAACLRYGEDTPLDEAYIVEKGGRRGVFTQEDVPVDLTSDPDATPLWEAGTEMDKMIMGRRVDRFISGEDRFRQRSR